MLNLVDTNDKISLITSSGADVDVVTAFTDCDSTTLSSQTFQGKKQITQPTTATTTDIVAAPSANFERNIKFISIRNIDAAVSQDVTVQLNDNGTLITLFKCTLLAGEELVFSEGVWFHYDTSGGVYAQSLPVASDTVAGAIQLAVQSDMESASSVLLAVTPGRQHFHPGHPKCWGKCTNAGGTPTLQTSYNMTSITDTATDQLTITIANDFSSAHYALTMSIEAATTSLSATTTSLLGFIRNGSLAAGSAILQACEIDVGGATDPASWHWIGCGDL